MKKTGGLRSFSVSFGAATAHATGSFSMLGKGPQQTRSMSMTQGEMVKAEKPQPHESHGHTITASSRLASGLAACASSADLHRRQHHHQPLQHLVG